MKRSTPVLPLILALCFSGAPARAQATFTLLHLFSTTTEPHFPMGTLVETSPGVFYGTTSAGVAGQPTPGALFTITSSGTLTFLHNFDGTTEGVAPEGALVRGPGDFLYGITVGGGSGQGGTIFKSDLAGNVTVLYSFSGAGTIPYSLVRAHQGGLYGTVSGPGPGMAYRLNAAGQPVTFHNFSSAEGAPAGSLLQASDGNLYGLSSIGVYQLNKSGTLTMIHTFSGNDGNTPIGNLSEANNGRLYGVNAFGGANGFGTVFSASFKGNFRVEHAFTGGSDGGFPLTGTARANDGNVYGSTGLGPGSIFRIDTSGNFTTLYTFQGGVGGNPNFPSAAVVQGSDGKLYGEQTTFGGSVYSLDVGLAPR